jgi:hypothetical protein
MNSHAYIHGHYSGQVLYFIQDEYAIKSQEKQLLIHILATSVLDTSSIMTYFFVESLYILCFLNSPFYNC